MQGYAAAAAVQFKRAPATVAVAVVSGALAVRLNGSPLAEGSAVAISGGSLAFAKTEVGASCGARSTLEGAFAGKSVVASVRCRQRLLLRITAARLGPCLSPCPAAWAGPAGDDWARTQPEHSTGAAVPRHAGRLRAAVGDRSLGAAWGRVADAGQMLDRCCATAGACGSWLGRLQEHGWILHASHASHAPRPAVAGHPPLPQAGRVCAVSPHARLCDERPAGVDIPVSTKGEAVAGVAALPARALSACMNKKQR